VWGDQGQTFRNYCQVYAGIAVKNAELTGRGQPTPSSDGTWKPPPQPDAQLIFDTMIKDSREGRLQDALAKQVWFHENALSANASVWSINRKLALKYWAELGKAFPPAQEKLLAARAAAVAKVKAGGDVWYAFDSVASINFALGEMGVTRDLFVWLEETNPALAQRCHNAALLSLVALKDYKRISPYIKTDVWLDAYTGDYRETMAKASQFPSSSSLRQSAKAQYLSAMTTLTALLVLADRRPEAERVAAETRKELADPGAEPAIAGALNGTLPEKEWWRQ